MENYGWRNPSRCPDRYAKIRHRVRTDVVSSSDGCYAYYPGSWSHPVIPHGFPNTHPLCIDQISSGLPILTKVNRFRLTLLNIPAIFHSGELIRPLLNILHNLYHVSSDDPEPKLWSNVTTTCKSFLILQSLSHSLTEHPIP